MSRITNRHHFLVSYDIADDRRRTEVFETCKDFGNHVQYSVFLCELDRRETITLRELLRELIQHDEDQVCCWSTSGRRRTWCSSKWKFWDNSTLHLAGTSWYEEGRW